MGVFGLPTDLVKLAHDGMSMGEHGVELGERGVVALERMATAMERQAAVMETDVADEAPEAQEGVWVRRYGEALSAILDKPDQFAKLRALRTLAATMANHGQQTETG